jgi:hypothetical protein
MRFFTFIAVFTFFTAAAQAVSPEQLLQQRAAAAELNERMSTK